MRISDWSSDVCSSDLYPRRDAAFSHATDESGKRRDVDRAHIHVGIDIRFDIEVGLEVRVRRAEGVIPARRTDDDDLEVDRDLNGLRRACVWHRIGSRQIRWGERAVRTRWSMTGR